MAALMSIGEFATVTHLSVKALRHYGEVGLLAPAEVDPQSGYRFYAAAQIPVAHVIRRFRDLDMPLEQVKAVLDADTPGTRDRVILEHLDHMESKLDATQSAVASLRELLEGRGGELTVEIRTFGPVPALAIREPVRWADTEDWLTDALYELRGTIEGAHLERAGPDGALYTDEFFETHVGDVVAFVPLRKSAAATIGRAAPVNLPAVSFAVATHWGSFADIDTTYGALGTYVMEQALGAEGPIRENYIVTAADTSDLRQLRTEVCWPVTPTGAPQ
jgi:DNA-binding transcriptional MerR regulator